MSPATATYAAKRDSPGEARLDEPRDVVDRVIVERHRRRVSLPRNAPRICVVGTRHWQQPLRGEAGECESRRAVVSMRAFERREEMLGTLEAKARQGGPASSSRSERTRPMMSRKKACSWLAR